MLSFNNTQRDDENPTTNPIHCCYSREKMLILNESPICLLRPPFFHSVVLHHPELLRLSPSPDICDQLIELNV